MLANNYCADDPLKELCLEFWQTAWPLWESKGSTGNLGAADTDIDNTLRVIPILEDTLSKLDVVIAANSNLAKQFGRKVGTVLWAYDLEPIDLIRGLVFLAENLLRENISRTSEMVSDEFDGYFDLVSRFLNGNSVGYEAVAPIIGVELEYAPLYLDNEVSLCQLNDDDDALKDVVASLQRIDVSEIPVHMKMAFRYTFNLPKLIDKDLSRVEATIVYERVETMRRNCIRAISTCTASRMINCNARVVEAGWRHWKRGSLAIRNVMPFPDFNIPSTRLSAQTEPNLRLAWAHVKHESFEKTNSAIRVALDRLSSLASRPGPEDQLVDALIACESFFTLGQSSKTELSFRTAINAASISSLIGFPMAKMGVVDFVLSAYDLRSRIVHGTQIREKDRRLNDKPMDLKTWAYYGAELSRRGVLWAFQRQEPGRKIEIDWRSFYFASESSI